MPIRQANSPRMHYKSRFFALALCKCWLNTNGTEKLSESIQELLKANYSKKHKVNLCLKSCKSRNMDIKWRLGTVWYEAKRISIQVQEDQCIGKSIFFVLVPSVWHRFLTPETPAKEIFAWETFWYIHQAPGSKKQRCIPSTNWVGRVELWLSSKWTERKTEIRLENRSINKAGHSSEKWRKTCKQTKQGLIILLQKKIKAKMLEENALFIPRVCYIWHFHASTPSSFYSSGFLKAHCLRPH